MADKTWLPFVILGCCMAISATDLVQLYPITVAQVCQAGDRLELTCTDNAGNFLRWNLSVNNEQGRLQEYVRNINSVDTSQQSSTIPLNSTLLIFMRNSNQGMTPLVSTLVISSVSIALNGTIVHCMDVTTSMVASTTIHILGATQTYFAGPVLHINSVNYGADNVTVTVMWTEEVGLLYNVQIVPSVPLEFNGSTRVQLMLSYNTEYTMSIGAATPCINSTTSYIMLNYISCGDPLGAVNDSTLTIIDYSDELTLEGTTIDFSCPTGLIINGTIRSTCMSDGRWEPDPQESACIEILNKCDLPSPINGYIDSYNLTEGGLIVNFVCQNNASCLKGLPGSPKVLYTVTTVCNLDGNWEPNLDEFCTMINPNEIIKAPTTVSAFTVTVATSAAVLLTSNVIIFILGFVCGHCCCLIKHKNTTEGTRDHQTGDELQTHQDHQPPTIYENVPLETEAILKVEEQDLAISTNVAYGHLHLRQ